MFWTTPAHHLKLLRGGPGGRGVNVILKDFVNKVLKLKDKQKQVLSYFHIVQTKPGINRFFVICKDMYSVDITH